jgi:tRNA1Val (adenine37-N6)-methyltransferase
MKVGTDGVLLGAWAPVENGKRLLDIGAGTGLVALMLAQRSEAEVIDAIEIEEEAFEQCVENFERSPWGDRLFCFHGDIQELAEEADAPYDLITCNPPFFETVPGEVDARARARQQHSLNYETLIACAEALMSEQGTLALIAPYTHQESLVHCAANFSLFPQRITEVWGHPESGPKRVLIAFQRNPSEAKVDRLIIEQDRHQYTEAYQALTRDFYLKM